MELKENVKICVKCKHHIRQWNGSPFPKDYSSVDYSCTSEKYAQHTIQCPVTGNLTFVTCQTANPSGRCEHWEAKPKPKPPKKHSWWKVYQSK